MENLQQIFIFIGIVVALCYTWYNRNLKIGAKDNEIRTTYLNALKKLKGNPKKQKLKDDVLEKGSAYYANIKKSGERLEQSDFDAIAYDINEVINNPKSLKDI
ncbi:MAG: hypothetical protein WBA54_14460 [Acidaminobacteraceae bacterium]